MSLNTENKFRRIDAHAHILPENIPDWNKEFNYGEFITVDKFSNPPMMYKGSNIFRPVEKNLWDMEARLKNMSDTHVQKQVLCTVPVMFSYWAKKEHTLKISEFLNNNIIETVNNYQDKFYALGTLPMNDPDFAVKEMKRCVEELGLTGFQIGSHIEKTNEESNTIERITLADKSLHKIWEAAEDLDVHIMVHPWDMMGQEFMGKYWLPWLVGMPAECSLAICSCIFGGIFEKFPKIRWMFAHGGGSFPFTLGRIEHGFNARPDLVQVDCKVNPKDYIGHFWVDTIVHDKTALKYNFDLFGEDKLICGSDYPFVLGEQLPGDLVCSSDFLSDQAKDKILYTNLLDWMNISKEEANLLRD